MSTCTPPRLAVSPFLVAAALAGFAVLTRVIPHPQTPNVTAVAASALLAGWLIRSRLLALAVPLGAMLISDAVIGWDRPLITLAVYASMGLPVLMRPLMGDGTRPGRLFAGAAAGSVAASVLFFITTNLAVWITEPAYGKNAAGLLECYTNAVPFFRLTAAGDFVFTMALFGTWAAASRGVRPARARVGAA